MENKKKLYIYLGLAGLVAAAIFIFWYLSRPPKVPLIDYVDPKLTQEEKQPFLDRLQKYQDELNTLSADAPKAQKFQLLLSIASEYYPIGEYKKSFDTYILASALFPEEPVPYYSMAYIAEQRGDYASARFNYRKAIEKSPDYGLYWRALIEFERDRYSASPETLDTMFKDALSKTNKDINVVTLYAQFLEGQGKVAEAVEQWQEALGQRPDYADLYQQEIDRLQPKK